MSHVGFVTALCNTLGLSHVGAWRERDGRMRVLAVAIIDCRTMPLLLVLTLFEAVDKSLVDVWCGRSVPESASKGFLRSLEKLVPRLKAVLPS